MQTLAPLGPLANTDKYISMCVCARVCVFREKEKHTGVDVGGGGTRICLAQHFFFSHTALTKAPLFWQPVSRGDALMIACCLSHGSRLNLRSGGDAPVRRAFMAAL